MQEITKLETNAVTSMSDFVEIKDEKVYTTSRIVAEKFGKEHKNVIQSIEELIKTMVQPIENIGKLKNQPAKIRFSGVNFNGSHHIYRQRLW